MKPQLYRTCSYLATRYTIGVYLFISACALLVFAIMRGQALTRASLVQPNE